jgi:hypothetical protein
MATFLDSGAEPRRKSEGGGHGRLGGRAFVVGRGGSVGVVSSAWVRIEATVSWIAAGPSSGAGRVPT